MAMKPISFQHREFEARLRRIRKSHGAMTRGFRFRVTPDGLMVPEGRRRNRAGGVLRAVFNVVAVLFVLKSFMLASLGDATYAGRLATLEAGNAVEKAGAYVMMPDPATTWTAHQLSRLLPF